MQFKIERNNLLKSLSHIQGVVERRNTIPILSNVKIETNEDNIRLTATDMDLALSEIQKANIEEAGSITVPAHTFHDIVRKLPEDNEVHIKYSEGDSTLQITTEKCNFSLPVIEANDFPVIETGDITNSFQIPNKDLLKLFDKSKFAISTEETRVLLKWYFPT